jgi:PAS domain S-box-containing protein
LFAVGWLASTIVWVAVLVLRSRDAAPLGVLTVGFQLLLLVVAGVRARRDPSGAAVRPTLVAVCIGLGASSTVLFVVARGGAEVTAFVLLTLFLSAALLFAWGWRAELVVIAATLAVAAVALPFSHTVVPAPAFAAAVLIGGALALAVAEGSARSFAIALRHRAGEAERRRELEASRDAYRDLAENARDFIYAGDLTGRITYVNAPLAEFVGEPVSAIVGRYFHDIMRPHPDNPDLDAVLAWLGAGESVPLLTFATRTAAGPRWVEVLSSGIEGPDGRIVGVRGIGRDVTERWRTAEALRESEERFRNVFGSAPIGMAIVALNGNALQVNRALCAMLGYDASDLVHASLDDLGEPADEDTITARAARALADGAGGFEIERRYRHKDGHTVRCHVTASLMHDAGGDQAYVIVQLQNITSRKEAEEALRESEERYRGLVESQHDIIARFDRDGRYTFVNDAYCRTLGLRREDLLGRWIADFLHPDDVSATFAVIAALEQPPYRGSVENRQRTADGWRWFSWEGCAIKDQHGTTVEIQSTGRDVTERRVAEESLHASLHELRRSEERLRLLAQRQAQIREDERKRLGFDLHDNVCQELVGIAILVESLRRRLAPLPEGVAAELDRVTRYLHELVEHLRVLARDMRPLLLRDLGLEGSLRSLAEGMASTTTRVNAEFARAIPRLDEELEVAVYRIAQEALANAARHADATAIVVALAVREGVLELVVRDDGRGFDPTHGRSEALGLVSMRERALALGGRLEVTSAPGKGTVVRLECPLVSRAAA